MCTSSNGWLSSLYIPKCSFIKMNKEVAVFELNGTKEAGIYKWEMMLIVCFIEILP